MISNSPGANQFIAKTWLLCLFVGTSPIGFGSFFKHHFVCQLSGLSSITKHSSMNNTHWKSNFKYVLVQKTCLAMWFGFSGGQIISLAHVSKHLRMCHHEVLRTFAALMTANDFFLLLVGAYIFLSYCWGWDKHPHVFPLLACTLHAAGFEMKFLIEW